MSSVLVFAEDWVAEAKGGICLSLYVVKVGIEHSISKDPL